MTPYAVWLTSPSGSWTCVWAKNTFRDVIPLSWRRVTLWKESSLNKYTLLPCSFRKKKPPDRRLSKYMLLFIWVQSKEKADFCLLLPFVSIAKPTTADCAIRDKVYTWLFRGFQVLPRSCFSRII